MINSRRKFIKTTLKATAAMSVMNTSLMAHPLNLSSGKWKLSLGICTTIENSALLKSLGYKFIEESVGRFLVPDKDDAAFAEQFQKLKAADLPVLSCNSFIPGRLKSVGPEIHHEEIVRYAETAFIRARKAEMKYIVFGSSGSRRIPEGWKISSAREQFIELQKLIAPVAKKYGITVVLEPLNKGEVNFINSLAEGAEIVESVNHPNFRLLADIYHMMREDEPSGEILKYGHLIHHCHIAEKEKRSAPGVMGDDFRPYLKALKETAYKGGLSLEGRWTDFEQEAAAAIKVLNDQMKDV